MPRKSKDELNKNEIINETKLSKSTTQAKKSSSSKVNTSKTEKVSLKADTSEEKVINILANSSKEVNNGKTSSAKVRKTTSRTKKASTKNDQSKTSKANSTKTSTATTKNSTAKASTSKAKTSASKSKNTTKRAKSTKTRNTASTKSKQTTPIVEYYDLPFRYNETVVKILAQTPNMLFIYWDISDSDKKSYSEKYGDDFFYKTKPVLLVTNKTMNYKFEVEINDFANSWYLHVNDANCDYSVELGRRPIEYNSNLDNYVYITTSNDMEMPNNRILFDKIGKTVFFKNVKNNFVEEKEISSISFIKNIGKIYDIYELYMEMYKNEINIEDLTSNNIKLNLSSSNSSTFK